MNSGNRTVFVSRAAAAVGIAALVNLWVQVAHPMATVPTANLDTGEVFQAVRAVSRDAAKSQPESRIALLGSSLMVAPVMQAEANSVAHPIERMTHRRVSFLEHQFNDQAHVYCMAVGGEMVSDAYLIAKHVLQSKLKPDAIVYGIAPRDFQDNLLPGVESTETFKTLASPTDVACALTSRAHNFESTADTAMTAAVPLWKYRGDMRVYANLRAKKTMEQFCPWVLFDKINAAGELKPQHKGQYPEEVKGKSMVFPGVAMNHGSVEATRNEYRQRYNPLNTALVNQQFSYLEKLQQLCKQNGVQLILVNMPLSADNIALMPAGFYDEYKRRVHSTAERNGSELIDMCTPQYQSASLYADGVHLESGVSEKFLQAMVSRLQSTRLATKFSKPL